MIQKPIAFKKFNELTLFRIFIYLNKFKARNIPILTMGDFKSDLNRENTFDKILLDFTSNDNLISLDSIFTQKLNFIYSKFNYRIDYMAKLDIFFVQKVLSVSHSEILM